VRGTENLLYLCAPINALVEGIYEEKIPFREIKRHGDFGLGTFDDLDGEMVMLDGEIFQIPSDGRVKRVPDEALTPFAAVTFYRPLSHDENSEPLSYRAFLEWLTRLLPSPNLFYALKIQGEFSYIKTRSVPKQECYRPLVEVTKTQPVFEFRNIRGTLAGFYTPSFMASLSVPGLHLHFLSDDLQHGGHLLECDTQGVNAGVQMLDRLEVSLPKSLEYLTWDFTRDTGQDLQRAEN
jgi:acetolactate decarboxylase